MARRAAARRSRPRARGDEDEAQQRGRSVTLLPATPKTREPVRQYEGRVRVCRVRRNRAWRHFRHFRGRGPRRPRARGPTTRRARGVGHARARLGARLCQLPHRAQMRGRFSTASSPSPAGPARRPRPRSRLRSTLEEKARAERTCQEEAALGAARGAAPGAAPPTAGRRGHLSARSAARRARIVELKKTRAKKRAKGLPLISSVDTQTHAAAVGVSGGDAA